MEIDGRDDAIAGLLRHSNVTFGYVFGSFTQLYLDIYYYNPCWVMAENAWLHAHVSPAVDPIHWYRATTIDEQAVQALRYYKSSTKFCHKH